MNTKHTEADVSAKTYVSLGYALRQEYQPKAVVAMANAESGAKKFIYGCGAGKTLMMGLGVAYQITDGTAKKIVVTAPSIRLCRQLEEEFIDIFSSWGIKKYIRFINVSSDGKKSKDLDVDDIAEEQKDDDNDEDVKIKKKKKTDADYICEKMGWHRYTMIEHDAIEAELLLHTVTVFFVCKPSFLKNFRYRVAAIVNNDQEFEIDITCHDEFHNFITTEKKQKCKSALQVYRTFSRNNWFFSASKRSTEGLRWTDPLFGELIDDVPSWQLVKWNYLVKELKIYIVTASMIKNVDFSVRQKFEAMYKAKASDFLREAKVLLKVTEHQLSSAEQCLGRTSTKGLLFSKRVAFTQEINQSPEFGARIQLLNSDFKLFQMDGSTKSEDRARIFDNLRNMNDDTPAWVLQHSVVKEGINAPNFDCCLLARGMGDISMQQALGRIQRKYSGKDCAYLYIYVDDVDYEKSMKELASFLHYQLGNYEVTVEKMLDDTSGTDDNDDNEDTKRPNLTSVKVKLKDPMVIIKEHKCKLAEDEKNLVEDEELNQKTNKELISELSFI